MDEVLVARGQLTAEQEIEVIDNFCVSLHLGAPWTWRGPQYAAMEKSMAGWESVAFRFLFAAQPAITPTITALARSMKKPHTSGTITNARGAAPYSRATAVMLAMAVAVDPSAMPPKPALTTADS